MFERFTDRARRVIVLAQEEARLLNHNWLGAEHILLGLVNESEGIAAKALANAGAPDLVTMRGQVAVFTDDHRGKVPSPGHIPFTPRGKKVLELALQLGHNYIGTEHVLLGIVKEAQTNEDAPGIAQQILDYFGVDLSDIRQQVIVLLSTYQGFKTPVPEPAPQLGVTVDRQQLIDGAEDYLVSLRTSLWGQAFDMFQKDSRRAAAEFLADAVLGVVERLEAKDQ